MIRLKNVRRPLDEDDAKYLRTLAGVMMQHHVNAPRWNLWAQVCTYVGARAYAKRSLQRVRG